MGRSRPLRHCACISHLLTSFVFSILFQSQLRQSLTDQAMGDGASRPSAAVGRGRRGVPSTSAPISAPVAWPSPRKPKSSSQAPAHASSSRPKNDFMLSRSSLDHELKVVLKRARQYAQSNIKLRQRLDQVSDDEIRLGQANKYQGGSWLKSSSNVCYQMTTRGQGTIWQRVGEIDTCRFPPNHTQAVHCIHIQRAELNPL